MGAEEEQRQQQQPKSSTRSGTEPPHADAKGEKRISYFDIFLKKNPCCFFFLLFWSNCTEQVWGAVTSAPRIDAHIDAQEKLSKQRKKNDFFAQSNYTNMSENSQEKNPKNQIWDTRVSNNSLFSPQTFK